MTYTKKKSKTQSKPQSKYRSGYKTKLQSKRKIYSSKKEIQNIRNNSIEKQHIVVSHYNDNTNIFHIFVKEIMGLWKYTKGNVNTIIILKNYVNNGLNNWRLNLLRKL